MSSCVFYSSTFFPFFLLTFRSNNPKILLEAETSQILSLHCWSMIRRLRKTGPKVHFRERRNGERSRLASHLPVVGLLRTGPWESVAPAQPLLPPLCSRWFPPSGPAWTLQEAPSTRPACGTSAPPSSSPGPSSQPSVSSSSLWGGGEGRRTKQSRCHWWGRIYIPTQHFSPHTHFIILLHFDLQVC